MDCQSKDAQQNQPSLEHGADKSLLDNALQELKDSSQIMSQWNVTVTDNLSLFVDLTQLQTWIAELLKQTSVLQIAHQQKQIAQTALHTQTKDALTSQLSLDQHAEHQFFLAAKKDAQCHNHFHQLLLSQHLNHNHFHHNHQHQ
jgi:cell division protein ZapA (FtsZ GTPase activity inhibitor)